MKLSLDCDALVDAVALEARAQTAHAAMLDELRTAAEETAAVLRDESPVDSGRFASSWRVAETDDGAEITNTAPYAEYVDIDATQAVPADLEQRAAERFERALETP